MSDIKKYHGSGYKEDTKQMKIYFFTDIFKSHILLCLQPGSTRKNSRHSHVLTAEHPFQARACR
jgi:hypothetical protein